MVGKLSSFFDSITDVTHRLLVRKSLAHLIKPWLLVTVAFTATPLATFGGDLARFTLNSFDTPYPALAAHLSNASTYPDAGGYVTITSTGGNYYMGADYWYNQYYWFTFKVEYGYAIDVDTFKFISKTYVGGPTQYAVEVYADGYFGQLTNGDWESLPGYGTGTDTDVVANRGGSPLTGLTGYVSVLCWGSGATSGSEEWYQRNMALLGSVRALPGTPIPLIARGVKATDGKYGDRVDVTWSAADGATSYELWRATNSAMTVATQVSSGSATNQSDTTAVPGTVYYYRVKSVNSGGASAYSGYDSGYRLAPPATPSAPSAGDGTSSSYVYVTWSTASGATGYEVWRGVSSEIGSASKVTGTSQYTASYYDYDVLQGSLYYYWLRATNAAGASAYSPYDTGYRGLSAPTGVNASDGTYGDRVSVSWTSATAANGYEVWRHTTSSSASAALIGTSGSVTYNDYSAVQGTTYYYWVKATNTLSKSGFSSYNTGYRPAPPGVPASLTASDGSYSSYVYVSWSSASGATSYQVWRGTNSVFETAVQVGTSSSTSYYDYDASIGRGYWYWVKSVNAAGTSNAAGPNSGYRSVSIPSSPAGVQASDGTYPDKVRVTWNSASGAVQYEIWRSLTNQSAGSTHVADTEATSYDDIVVSPGVTNYYWIKAGNVAGVSGFSPSNSGFIQALTLSLLDCQMLGTVAGFTIVAAYPPDATVTVWRCHDLVKKEWTVADQFVLHAAATNWSETLTSQATSTFYRVTSP